MVKFNKSLSLALAIIIAGLVIVAFHHDKKSNGAKLDCTEEVDSIAVFYEPDMIPLQIYYPFIFRSPAQFLKFHGTQRVSVNNERTIEEIRKLAETTTECDQDVDFDTNFVLIIYEGSKNDTLAFGNKPHAVFKKNNTSMEPCKELYYLFLQAIRDVNPEWYHEYCEAYSFESKHFREEDRLIL